MASRVILSPGQMNKEARKGAKLERMELPQKAAQACESIVIPLELQECMP